MTAPKPKRGGRRPGAGRPPVASKLARVTAFVSPEVAAEVARLCALELTRGDLLAIVVDLAASDRDRFLQLAFRQLARNTARKDT